MTTRTFGRWVPLDGLVAWRVQHCCARDECVLRPGQEALDAGHCGCGPFDPCPPEAS